MLIIIFAIGFSQIGLCSWLYDLESIDELFEAYAQGDIDFEALTLLSDAYDLGGLNQEDLLAAGAIERIDPLTPQDGQLSGNFWTSVLSKGRGKFGIRRTSDNEGNITGRYYVAANGEFWQISGQAEENREGYTWDRRGLTGRLGPAKIALGNFIISEGYGLTIGRFDYLPSTGLPANREEGFSYPVNSYYNGLKLTADVGSFSGRVYYSRKKYVTALKQFAGAGINLSAGSLSGGFSAGINRLEQSHGRDESIAAGFSLQLDRPLYKIGGEFAFIDKAPGVFLATERKFGGMVLKSEFWRYDDKFESYNCSGPAATDYRSFYLEEDGLGFRSAQAGETGMLAGYGTSRALLSAQFWSRAQDEAINSSVGFRLRSRVTNVIEGYIQGTLRDKVDTDYRWIKFGLVPEKGPAERIGIKLYARNSPRITNSYSFIFIDIAKALKQYLNTYLRVKLYLNGRERLLLGERVDLGWGVRGQAEAVIDRGTIANLKIEKIL